MRNFCQKKIYGFAQIAQINRAKPSKSHCISFAKIVQKFAEKNLRENSANFAQKI